MTLRKFLLIPLVASLALFAFYSSSVSESWKVLTHVITLDGRLVWMLSVAALLQLIGHSIRAYKARLLLDPIKPSTVRFQFRALSIGYLFNTLLPFRIGELLRARVTSGALNISFSFALLLIIVERALDALILGLIGLILIFFVDGIHTTQLLPYISWLLIVASTILGVVALLIKQNNFLLKAWFRITSWLNDNLKNGFRFKGWSIIYGLQHVCTPARLVKYVGLTLVSWGFYLGSLLVLMWQLFPRSSLSDQTVAATAPYYGVVIPSGPANLGVFSRATNTFASYLHLGHNAGLVMDLLAWGILIVPISTLGLVLLFVKTKETVWQKRPRQASRDSLINKLYRSEDISYEMASFLENYFAGNGLSRIVHKLELRDNFRLLKYFKGGSDAITILALQDNQQVVKKIIPIEFKHRLKAQYDWLDARRGVNGIVEVFGEESHPDYYAIDLAFQEDDITLFEHMHKRPLSESKRILHEVWGNLFMHVYGKPKKLATYPKRRDEYIQRHVFDCLEKASAVSPELLVATKPKKIIINGKEYDNLTQILARIKRHPKAWKDIATYQDAGVVHGDVAVDNILVSGSTGRSLLIDPAPDGNIINGPVFDFGKNMQSLYCGYEFMLRDESTVHLTGNAINYHDHNSAQYIQLCEYVQTELAPSYLSESELKSMLFHAGVLHIRRLKHQVYYTPSNALKFYAIGVKTLNDFLAQYD